MIICVDIKFSATVCSKYLRLFKSIIFHSRARHKKVCTSGKVNVRRDQRIDEGDNKINVSRKKNVVR